MFHKRLLREFSDNRKYVIGMVAAQWVSLLANVLLVFVLANLIEAIALGNASGRLWYLAGVFAAAFLVRAAASAAGSRWSHLASANVKHGLRSLVYEKLMRLGTSYRKTIATSEAVQISTEGVEQLEIYFGKYVPQFFYSMLAPLTLFVIVGTMSLKVAAALLLCVPLIPVSIIAVQKFAKRLLAKYWGSYTELGDSFLENLQGLTTLKIYQADERYARKMDEEAERFRRVTMRVLIMQPIPSASWILWRTAALPAGSFLAFWNCVREISLFAECFFITMISAEFFLPLRLLGSFFHIAMNGNAAADKIFGLLDEPEPVNGMVTEVKGSDIVFCGVGFGYDENEPVFSDVSFAIPERSFAALVGASGCGKSTIASLLMGSSRGYTGSITIGGVELSEIAPETLYRKITRVSHESYLFAGTVMENLKMGKSDAGISEMEEALRRVELYDTVMEKGGLQMKLSEKASNLSGGQRQRLALARALLHDSDIYIFDEATSNIDVESENKIMEVVTELAHEKTVLLISHRLANVTGADAVFVLKEKQGLTESGTHTSLMEADGAYASLYLAQQELEQFAGKCAGMEEQSK